VKSFPVLKDIKKPLLKKRHALEPRRIEKRGVGEFLKKNFVAIVGGAVVTAGGLWLWEKFMKKRAEKAAMKKFAAGEGDKQGKQGLNVLLEEGNGRSDGEEEEREKGKEGVWMKEEKKEGKDDGQLIVDTGEEDSVTGSEKEDVCTDCEHC
jgi:hypothetical protein